MSEALEILKSCDAFLEGHFLLSSGRHSSAYCQMAYLQQYPDRCAEVMKAVADKVKELDVDVIVGPAMGGIVYAYELARQTGKRAIFTERVDNVMTLKRFAIQPGEKCIIAEDVVTTGISSLETKRVIEEAGGICLGITWQITDTQPKLSTAFNFLIMAFSFAIFWVPNAWTMVTMEVSASGIAATARATANNSASRRLIFRNMQRANTRAQTTMIRTASFPLN